MSSSRLRLNHKKTEVTWLGLRQQLDKLSVQQVTIVSSPVIVSSHARDMGVITDSQLSLSGHVNALCRLSEMLSSADAVAASHQVIVEWRRQDTGAGVCVVPIGLLQLTALTDDLFQRLQGIQNAAARLIRHRPP